NFHVSGVVAVVTLAIMFASVGRTRISPEVAGFLHHFWEMMAHMANTLIFLLVGILVAIRVPLDDKEAWLALFVLYLGIMAIRACSITVFMPILKRIGIGITYEKAVVLCWGG
ncbi:peptidase, partial [Vibrio vulnificus]